MATPTTAPPTLRPDLAEFMEFDLENERRGYVALQVLPPVEVSLQADNPGRVPLETLLQEADTARNDRGTYNRVTTKFETFAYATKENGIEVPIDDREKNRYRHLLQVEQISNAKAWGIVSRNHEIRVAGLVFNPTTFNGASLTTAITHEWDDATNCVPITDVEAAVKKVYDNSGLDANALVINKQVFRNLRNSNQIRDRIEASGAGFAARAQDITIEMLKAVFDLDYIIVAGASRNTANEAKAATPTRIWSGEYAMVCRIAESADMREPCLGRTFHWSEDGSLIGGTVEEYEETQSRSRIIRVRHDTDEVIMYPQAGHLLSNITT
jgi:hypothetical protein